MEIYQVSEIRWFLNIMQFQNFSRIVFMKLFTNVNGTLISTEIERV